MLQNMNILILRVGRLGDIVMIVPAILAIKKQFPQANIKVITTKDGIRVLKSMGFKDDALIAYDHKLPMRLIGSFRIKLF